MTDQKVASIKGTITLADGSESEFQIGTDYGWSQWGAYRERLSETVPVLDAMVMGFQRDEVRFVSDYDEPEDEESAEDDDVLDVLIGYSALLSDEEGGDA